MRRTWGIVLISAAATSASVVLAEDVVHFTNGAEMTVRGHTIEKDMVKLDLGGSSSITFPVSMVDKIVNAGKNVFLNPVYHPSNQAVAVAASELPSPLPDRGIRGGGTPVGYRLGQSQTGTGLRLGEPSNNPGDDWQYGGSGRVTTVSDERTRKFSTPQPRRFDPLRPEPPGTRQTIDPPSGGPARREPAQVQIRVSPPGETTPAAPPTADSTLPPEPPTDTEQEAPPPQDPPESL